MEDLRKNYLQSLYSKKKSCNTNGYEKNSCSQASRRLFSSWSGAWRRAWGGAKGRAKSRSFLVSRFAPVPRTQRKNSGRWTGKRKETTGDLARMHAQP